MFGLYERIRSHLTLIRFNSVINASTLLGNTYKFNGEAVIMASCIRRKKSPQFPLLSRLRAVQKYFTQNSENEKGWSGFISKPIDIFILLITTNYNFSKLIEL